MTLPRSGAPYPDAVQPSYPVYAAAVRDPTDVIGRRIAALVIDWSIAFVLFIVLALSLGESRDLRSSFAAESECERINDNTDSFCVPVDTSIYVYSGGEVAALFLLPLAYHFLSYGLLTGVTGFSVGKGLVGLRVIRLSDGRHCGVGRSLLRWLLWVADAQPCGLPVVGLVTGLATKGHRRVGDMAAGTLVVDKRDVGVTPIVPGLNAMTPPPWGPTAWGAPIPTWSPPAAPGPATPPQWGQPAAPPPPVPQWAPPAPPTPPQWDQPAAPVAVPAPTPGVDSPLWDDARDTYIQWDPDLASWVQWDDRAKQWQPIR
jgi:uncharacterized RDD family membrane protein YckC